MGVVGYKASNKNDNNADFANSTLPIIFAPTRKVRCDETLTSKSRISIILLVSALALIVMITNPKMFHNSTVVLSYNADLYKHKKEE